MCIQNIINDSINLFYSPYCFLVIFLCFVLGSIPFGLIISYISGYGDIRKLGSGNIGATNVLRTGNKFLALLTLIADLSKGFLAIYISNLFLEDSISIELLAYLYSFIAIAVVFGHMFSPWLKFKGGKGVATSSGILIFICWPCFIMSLIIWVLFAISTKRSSIGGLLSSLSAPVFLWSLYQMNKIGLPFPIPSINFIEILAITVIVVFIWIKHNQNIKRIFKKEEPKIS